MSAAEAQSTPGSAGAPAVGESLDTVRDILFGAQARESEKRIAGLEQRVQKTVDGIREETRKRLDAIEAYINKEVQALLEQIKTEQTKRAEADKDLASDLAETTKTLTKRIADLEESSTTAQRELRKQILDQSKILTDELHKGLAELRALVDRTSNELSNRKADRTALASMLTDVAAALSDDKGKAAKKK